MTHGAHPEQGWKPVAANAAGRLAVMLVIVVAAIRAIVGFSPNLYWATDPRLDDSPVIGLGAAGAVALDWLGVAALLLAVICCAMRGRRVHGVLILLWVVGYGFAMIQAGIDSESIRIGGNWTGAIALGLAAMHLASRAAYRRTILAAVIALIVPLAARAVLQVAVEHRQTVADYEQNREQRLRQRGWEPGSTEAVQFEVRLRQNEASGRFGLANVFASVVMMLTVAAAGIALTLARKAPRGPPVILAVALTLSGLVALALSFSKGAAMALVATCAAIGVAWWLPRFRIKWSLVALLIVAAGIVGVLVRGQLGPPESHEGERSLLFRYYYWQAAWSMWKESPFTGVGPGRFQEAYLVYKNPLNPEEVADAHNAFVAFISTLGIGGLAWSALLLGMLWRSGGLVQRRREDSGATGGLPAGEEPNDADGHLADCSRTRGIVTGLASLLVFAIYYAVTLFPFGAIGLGLCGIAGLVGGIGIAVRRGMLKAKDGQPARHSRAIGAVMIVAALLGPFWIPQLGEWFFGAIAFFAVAWWLGGREELDSPVARLGLFAAAAAMMLHAQIDMSVTNMMAGPVLLVVLGVSAAVRDEPVGPTSRWTRWPAVPLCLAALLMMSGVAWVVAGREFVVRAAAETTRRDLDLAVSQTLPAMHRLRPPILWLRVEEAQYLLELGRPAEALRILEEAREFGTHQAKLWHAEASLCRELHRRTNDPAYVRRAARAAEWALAHDPYNILAQMDAGDLLWQLGDRQRARNHYRRALELHDLAYLIPHKQLQPDDLQHVRSRLE